MIKKFGYIFTLSIIVLTIFSLQVNAIPSMSSPIEFSQPSGEKFKAAIQGDEFMNWISTGDGDVLVQDSDKYWKYAEISSKKIKPSKIKYKIDKPKTKLKNKDILNSWKQNKLLRTNELKVPIEKKALPTAVVSSSDSTLQVSSSGYSAGTFQPRPSEKLLVILVEFADTKLKFSNEEWANRFFGTSGSTVNNYYQEVSNNTFKFLPAEETNNTSNDGVIRVSLNYSHPNTASQIDGRNQKIVFDALTAANPYIDYRSFDTDNNGSISPNEVHIITVVAGYDRSASGSTPSVWGHSWALYGNYYASLDGVGIYKYTQMGEKISFGGMSTIGLPCHELGHDLGLPDLYDYGYDSYGLGIHTLMAGGSWNTTVYDPAGSYPAHLDAYCKIKVGFANPTVVDSGTFSVNNFSTNQYNILKVNTSDLKQYFLLENRQFLGFDKPLERYVKRAGIAIYHVDESIGNNDNETRKLVDLEEANEGALGYSQLDNCYSGNYDHYFSSEGFSQINSSTIPSTNLYNNILTNHKFRVISVSGNSMFVEINNPEFTTLSLLEAPLANSVVSRTSTISGWLLEPDGVQDINVSVDGVLAGKAIYGDPRADIFAQYPAYKNPNSGFHYDLDTSKFTNGMHTLSVTELNGKGSSKSIGSISIKVLNGVTISYKLSMDSAVTILIKDNSENVVRTLEKNISKKVGLNSMVWDGNNDAGDMVNNGAYYYNITAKSIYGMASTPASGVIIVGDGPEIMSVNDSPDPFAPDEQSVCTISFRLTEKAKTILKLFDSSGNLVKTLIDKDLEAGNNSVNWKGDDSTGKILKDGTYYYTIDAVNASGKKAPQVSGTVTINTVPPSITTLGYSPTVFNPYTSKLQICFTLSKNCKTTVDIFDSSNNLVNRIENSVTRFAGLNQALWDGKNNSGTIVQSGTYKLVISLVDLAGLTGQPGSANFTVKSEAVVPPVISGAKFEPNPFNPTVNGSGILSFNYSKAGYITLQVFNSSNILVRTIANNTLCPQGTNTFTWNGKDSSGVVVPAGTYTFTISGSDQSGLSAVPVSGTITVLGNTTINKPAVSNLSASPNPFNPDANQQSKIQYSISIGAPVKITIVNGSGNLVKTVFDGSVNAGVNSTVWDGKNSNGTIVSSGIYNCKVQALDTSGQIVNEVSGTILVDKEPPSISVDGVEPNPFTPIE